MRLDHPVFRGPSRPTIDTYEAPTPAHYRDYPEGRDMPERLSMWKVQQGPAIGLVAPPWGFEDSPDAEVISSGVNSKGPTSVALARQANLFLWGFAGDPTQMTESGRRVFINVLCYMDAFDGHRLLVRREHDARDQAVHYASITARESLKPETRQRFLAKLPESLVAGAAGDAEALEAALGANIEALRFSAGRFEVDADVTLLGGSNRSLQMLDTIANRLAEDPNDELARRVLARYLPDGAKWDAAQLREWLAEYGGRVFFSDAGGYRWFVDTNPQVVRSLTPSPSSR
jgi:hypothetical protein